MPMWASHHSVGKMTADIHRLCEQENLQEPRFSQFDENQEFRRGDCESNVEDVNRHRQDYFAAEEARLERFCRDLGERGVRIARIEDRVLWLDDGSRLIRLPGEFGRGCESTIAVYLAATPVTNEQYRRFLISTGYLSPPTWQHVEFRTPDAPVVGVTWFEAKAYAAWAGGDLPTYLEWKTAATEGDPKVEYATWNGQLEEGTAHFGVQFAEGAPVSNLAYPANRLGYYGMCGNTWDWCSNSDGPHRIICGGGYMDSSRFCRVKAVYRNAPIDRDCSVGFRIKIPIG